ncbi:Predicted dithiol-disulfide isomerase, DsbA family [Polynucleobacter meluiroseus]|uniref:Predicted dithiol-disulfide isomerase, DsbA family n=1 Tax=Polynucleobacter meluiroseus TaxID=1938814 RepID=A0A240E2N0_9BURK|nr:DsbA family protein [Polynucleobacter meluiroseus]SNX29184.1 Predicted dithiol-disulfide isomerase, DsbA family [Polynucleobacter meluiroseus]
MIQIQIWGDFECPFSYLQTLVLLKLKDKYGDAIEIIWRAFELNPDKQVMTPTPEYLENLQAASQELIAAQAHLKLISPKYLTNIRLAQESVYFADVQGLSLKMAIALFDAFFNREIDISKEEEILKIADRLGLNSDALNVAWRDGKLTSKVILDEQEFRTYGFQGVPAMLIGEKDFSPRSFTPVIGYKTPDELDLIISKVL